MARTQSPQLDPKRIGGLKRIKELLPLLQDLRPVGCERDAAGNRELHFDEYVTLVLLYLFNPMIDSMRSLQRAAAVEKVAQQLDVKRFSLGSFSESVRVFDPEKLKATIFQLSDQLQPVNADPRLKTHLKHHLKIVDGTVLDAISTVAAALWVPYQDGTVKHAWKLHVQLDFDHFVPSDVELTDARNSGKAEGKASASDEKNVLRQKLKKDTCYVLDRWFGQFTLFERIGGDTLGPIFKAKSRKDGTLVSLKILPPAVAKNERLLKRFDREVSLAAKLRHPNVVGGVGVGAQDGIHFLVLEYVDGVDLAEILHRVGPPEIHKTVGYMVQAAGGLQYLHENKVYHRNVKPGNLLVDRSGVVKISNLLMAHIVEASYLDGNDDALTRTGEMLRTVDYVAPEQAGDASTADERADIYSLGCTMFHLLAGRPPYTGKNMMDKLVAHREAPIPSLAALRPDVSKGLERVVTRMLAKKRTERQQSMNEVIAALKPHATPGSRQGFWSRLVPHR